MNGCATGWIGTGTDPCPVAGKQAIDEYEAAIKTYGEENAPHWMAYYGKLLNFCEAQDARLK